MSFFRKLFFGKYLMITNTVSGGLMMGIGDFLQQRREQWKQKYIDSANELENMVQDGLSFTLTQCSNNFIQGPNQPIVLTNLQNHDITRTKNMATIGLMQGPFNHYFYVLLDRFLPGKTVVSLAKKTIIDQFVGSPTNLVMFFFGHELLEQRNPREVYKDIVEKVIETYKIDCCFWPPTQLLNFMFVPIQYRVIYVNIMNVIWNVFLSYSKYM
ncbi:mpv17-like protein 2 isoform X2 [Chelonus insularis]|uniref:mpv17-like protein 2 isoform X2 n=1 Tax=Chelonus insularis TaxID=460826 RepID=UPI00158EA862|nr:mpv17-like protein 2 isoform X2 [Chelonus insularis]